MLVYILVVSFITIINFNYIVSTQISLSCLYSKYMLYYMNTKVVFFKKIESINPILVGKIEELEDELKSMGEVVLIMLENIYHDFENKTPELTEYEYNSYTPYKTVEGLLTLNFYLNHFSEYFKIRSHSQLKPQEKKLNETNNFIKLFQQNYPIIIQNLKKSVSHVCFNGKTSSFNIDFFCYDKNYQKSYPDFEYLNKLLPKLSNYNENEIVDNNLNKMKVMEILDDSEVDLLYYLKKKPKRDNNTEKMIRNHFHPNNILLSGLFKDKRTTNGIDLLTGSPDPMNLFRSLHIDAKLENGNFANVTTLYEMIQHDIDVTCLISYQRQIIAATIHPVYYWISTFTQLLKKIFFSESNNISEIEIRANIFEVELGLLGDTIQKVIRTLISYKLFPENVQFHLEASLMQIVEITKFLKKDHIKTLKVKWIDQLYGRCASIMKIHLLKFGIDVNFPKVYHEEDCKKIIIRLKNNIKEVQLYVENLIHYKKDYNNIFIPKHLFYSDFMFSTELRCNIVEKYKRVYHFMDKMK
ncbi:uncharacterized protein LOC126904602 isoform X3 [Daktulosphaira vitifoliae]|uniref:uncharacterized protein LOC126904602 isoform X3 n=1 Tax=Daktulosphaira vitifoliae TaxID=58002 RepID=UPI0021AA1630|nr:uncharacterized protein LOC126904602 isoform X3 [Daktulosphaira vitifoliae]